MHPMTINPAPDPAGNRWTAFNRITAQRNDTSRALDLLFACCEEVGVIDLESLKQHGAIDFGAGGGRDTRHLHELGWQVTAVDTAPGSRAAIEPLLDTHDNPAGFVTALDQVEGQVGLFNASNVLPFLLEKGEPRATLGTAFAKLVPGGVLNCNFFGPSHGWSSRRAQGFTPAEARELVEGAGFQVVTLVEDGPESRKIADGSTVQRHDIFVVARKAGAASSASHQGRLLLHPGLRCGAALAAEER